MSKKINIRGLTDNSGDIFYRYKMEKLICIDQKGKTVVNNIDNIAKAIDRDPKNIANHFKKRLGTAMVYKDSKITISKTVTVNELEQLLFEFIEYNVLCPVCKNPETIVTINKKNKQEMTCKACSFTG